MSKGTTNSHSGDPAPRTSIPSDTQFLFPVINDRLGALRILEPIAAGGMAVVYKVKHEELEVIRAIKVLKPGYTEETRQRLLTEAKISANLHHPHIAQIYNVGLWRDTIPYIEMEYVHGSSLKDLLAQNRRVPFLVVAAIGTILCRAIDFARQQTLTLYGKSYQGLVHRDIKPANILISSGGEVKLVDFGIARPGSVSIHTTDSVIMGTSPYLSPEQIRGEILDHRTDIYSLGTVMYEMLSGEKAFPQPAMPTLMNAKLEGKYEPLKNAARDIPPELCDIVNKAMTADKARRYENAQLMGEALDELIKGFTDKPPSCLVRDYVNATSHEHLPQTSHTSPHRSNSRFLIGMVIAFLSMALLLGAAIFLQDRFLSRRHTDENLQTDTSSTVPPALEEPPAPPKPAPAVSAKDPVPRKSTPRTASETAPEPGPAPQEEDIRRSEAAEPDPVSLLNKAKVHFEQKEFSEAIGLFRSALNHELTGTNRLHAELLLIDALSSSGNTSEAAALARTTNASRDAYYLLLRARVLQQQGQHRQAQSFFDRAVTLPSVAGEGINKKAAYEGAENRYLLYRKKPNAENRKDALASWRLFHSRFCSSAEPRCGEADRKIDTLSR